MKIQKAHRPPYVSALAFIMTLLNVFPNKHMFDPRSNDRFDTRSLLSDQLVKIYTTFVVPRGRI